MQVFRVAEASSGALAKLRRRVRHILAGSLGLLMLAAGPEASAAKSQGFSQPNLSRNDSRQTREIKVQLLADSYLFQLPGATGQVESALREVAAEFKRLFALTFVPSGWSTWESDQGSRNVQELAEKFRTAIKGRGADLILAVTARSDLQSEYSGLALFKASTIIIVYTPDQAGLKKLIKHELGHVFGAVHVPDQGSVMSCSGEGHNFDAANENIIRLGRQRSFEPVVFPFSPEIQARIEGSYLKIRENITQLKEIKLLFSASGSGPPGQETKCLSDVFLMLAQLELEKNNYDRASDFCGEALLLNPGDLETMNLQAISFRQAGRTQEAINLYRIILEIKPDFSEALYNLGVALSELNRLAEAEKAYLKVIKLNPRLAQAYHNLGDVYFKQGRLDEAEQQFLKAIELWPSYASAYSNLGEIYWRRKDRIKAREYAEKTLSLQPESTQARNLLGNLLRDSGKPAEALNEYQKILAREPESARAYYNLGVSLTDLGQWSEARQAFEQAIKIEAKMAEAYGGLGLCYLQQGDLEQAIKFLLTARQLGFKDPALSLNLSYAYLNIKDWPKAEEEAWRAIAEQPDLALGYNNLGLALAQQNKLDEARMRLEEALKIDPQDRGTVINLAMVELSLKNEERALELFLKALVLNPEDSQNGLIYNNIAVIYFHREKYELSWEFAQKALQAGFKVDNNLLQALIKKLK